MSTPEAGPFCKTTWSKVKAGDVVLISGRSQIVEIQIHEVSRRTLMGQDRIGATCSLVGSELTYYSVYDPEEIVYVQQR